MSAVCNVRNLGTWFDNHLSLKTTIKKTCQSGLYHLHNIGRIKRFLSCEERKLIVQASLMSRIDYCNSLLYGVANRGKTRQSDRCAQCQDMRKSHRHLYVFNGCRLSLESNIKIAMLCFKCIHWRAPSYLKSMVAIKKTSTYNRRSSTSIQLEDHSWDDRKKRLAIVEPFSMHLPRFGTVSRNHYSHSKILTLSHCLKLTIS